MWITLPGHDNCSVSCVLWISFYCQVKCFECVKFLCVRSKYLLSCLLSEMVQLKVHWRTNFLPFGTCWIFNVPWQIWDDDIAFNKMSSFLWVCIQVECRVSGLAFLGPGFKIVQLWSFAVIPRLWLVPCLVSRLRFGPFFRPRFRLFVFSNSFVIVADILESLLQDLWPSHQLRIILISWWLINHH